mmetsp:Transcript_23881/g.73991  ORF Transcript_23881/g.73991 Transcript_23881/m.73991 type:complete len:315 (+) Transcript_23881:381-1325(+)
MPFDEASERGGRLVEAFDEGALCGVELRRGRDDGRMRVAQGRGPNHGFFVVLAEHGGAAMDRLVEGVGRRRRFGGRNVERPPAEVRDDDAIEHPGSVAGVVVRLDGDSDHLDEARGDVPRLRQVVVHVADALHRGLAPRRVFRRREKARFQFVRLGVLAALAQELRGRPPGAHALGPQAELRLHLRRAELSQLNDPTRLGDGEAGGLEAVRRARVGADSPLFRGWSERSAEHRIERVVWVLVRAFSALLLLSLQFLLLFSLFRRRRGTVFSFDHLGVDARIQCDVGVGALDAFVPTRDPEQADHLLGRCRHHGR